MENVIKDAIHCLNVINGYFESTRNIGKVYQNTNEDLNKVLGSYDFKNKNVLSVLASSDQFFSCYYLGAKNVDTFDSNILTYYYFFLKKWTILKTGKPYIPNSNKEILDIINCCAKTEEEIKVAYFWKYVIANLNVPLYHSELFYLNSNMYCLPYSYDMDNLAKIIKNKNPNYNKIDLFEPLNNFNKKYEIIVLSNILEYLYENEMDIDTHINVAKNIYNLLDDNGIAISSNIIDYNYKGNYIFEKYLKYIEGPNIKNNYFNLYEEIKPICYVYKKIKS